MDISVDLDHLTNNTGWFIAEKFDDIDSISEFLVEKICHNDDLFTESNNDDSHQSKNHHHKFSLVFFYAGCIRECNVNPAFKLKATFHPVLRNTMFLPEDHSYSDYNPPDLFHSLV